MKKILLLCLLAASFAMAAKKNVAVFSCFDDGSLDDGDLKKLSIKIEEIGHEVLDKSDGFAFISRTKLAEKEEKNKEVIFKGCDDKGGTCLAKITKDANADFGTWCQVYKDGEGFTLLFQLYDNVEKITYKPKMFDHLKNADDALEKISKEIPSSFREMLKDIAKACKAKGKGYTWDNDECKSDEQTNIDDCYAAGKKWRDGKCKSQKQIECELGGEIWIGETADPPCKPKKQVECEDKGGRWESNASCTSKADIEKERKAQKEREDRENCVASGRNYINGKCEAPVSVPMSTTMPQPTLQTTTEGFGAYVTTTPSEATLLLNGEPPIGCPKTPCQIRSYKETVRLTANLNGYKTADTTFIITQPNQPVTIKLEPKDYAIYFESNPPGVLLSLNGETNRQCQRTPCTAEFKRGSVKVRANPNSDLYEAKDTTIAVSGDMQVKLSLNGKYGTLNVKTKGEGWNLAVDNRNYSLYDVKLLPGTYKAKLTHELYEDIDFSLEIKKGVNLVFDASDKIVHRYGYLEINPNDNNWAASIGDRSYYSQSLSPFLPGTYKVKLTDECYEDIDFDVEIKRGESSVFDISDKIEPRKSNLSLYVKYKGRNQSEPVLIDGKEAGNTPFKSLVPVCSKSAELGKDRINVDLRNLKNGGVEYTHNLPTLKSTLLSLAIGAVGGVLLYNAYSYNAKTNDYMDEYHNCSSNGMPWCFDDARKKANDANGKVPIFLISGTGLVVSAVGVYLWF